MRMKDLGMFYGISLTNADINNHRIELTTKKPYLAKTYLNLIQQLTESKKDVVIYVEDIEYGRVEEELNKIKIIIPKIEEYEYYVFQRPDEHNPRIVVKLYNSEISQKIIGFLKHLNLLLENVEFSQGFIDAVLDTKAIVLGEEIIVRLDYLTNHFQKALQTIKQPYVIDYNSIKIRKQQLTPTNLFQPTQTV